ncbi:hypothetical protein LK536_18650 [Lachnoclostridium pacaense]|uniref:hypothetical protein n=1 Tax=Enterocloster hominis (ex Hitch et al. 2024) TaxID=1917870 RepID=UPI001D12CA64|nr:hypothetical protein [Lachnoclostridium pacaense]MCC2878298.1 hypothetical protein [Lachnoclostridium pacaense]
MRRLTVGNIIAAINHLNKNVDYDYINSTTTGKIHITRIKTGGPIYIKRYNPSLTLEVASKQRTARTLEEAQEVSISAKMIQRYVNAIEEGKPVNIDRVLGASYNTRSVLESLLAYTPEFYYCYPGRIYIDGGKEKKVEKGHKHLIWLPDMPHETGKIALYETNLVISEIPQKENVYDALHIPATVFPGGMDIEIQRRHVQIQIALYYIGLKLGYKTWIAKNDKGITYQGKRLCEFPEMISSLDDETMLSAFPEATDAATYIDCIWFKDRKWLPSVMEVEHTTGIKTGIDRMMVLKDTIPSIDTRYVIVAPDEDRSKVFDIACTPMYRRMDIKYLAYSSVEELFWICNNRNIGNSVNDSFIDCFLEKTSVLYD